MSPAARALFERFAEMIGRCGEYHFAPAKTRIAFVARVRFANVTKIRGDAMHCTFALPSPVRSPRVVKHEEVVPGWWVHTLHITDLAQLDDEVQGWLRDSYRLMGMQERLAQNGTLNSHDR